MSTGDRTGAAVRSALRAYQQRQLRTARRCARCGKPRREDVTVRLAIGPIVRTADGGYMDRQLQSAADLGLCECRRERPLPFVVLLLLAALVALLAFGCIKTFYEPAICTDERWDTVSVIAEGQQYYVRPQCETWRALSDSTMCWGNDTNRKECP